jgi:Holliday junction resolvasome RuvABC DNA-binding subunit
LGFNKQDVAEAISQIPEEIKGAKERLREALKLLGR